MMRNYLGRDFRGRSGRWFVVEAGRSQVIWLLLDRFWRCDPLLHRLDMHRLDMHRLDMHRLNVHWLNVMLLNVLLLDVLLLRLWFWGFLLLCWRFMLLLPLLWLVIFVVYNLRHLARAPRDCNGIFADDSSFSALRARGLFLAALLES